MFEIYCIGFGITLLIFALAARQSDANIQEIEKALIVLGMAILWPVSWLTMITYAIISSGDKAKGKQNGN